MSYPIDEIEGIGPAFREKLDAAEIKTTEDLLEHCGSRSGRASVAQTTQITEGSLLKWANMADLMRLNGVGRQFAELLEASGVDTVKEIAQRNAASLTSMISETNQAKRLARSTPNKNQVTSWITQAKKSEPRISH